MWYKKKTKKKDDDLPLFKGQKIAKKPDYKAKLDKVFSLYIRYRDTRYRDWETDRKSTRLNSSHRSLSRMPSSA